MVILFNVYCLTHWRHITKDQMREHGQNKRQKKTIVHKRVNLMKYCEMLTFLSISDWTKMLTKFRRILKCMSRQSWFRKKFRFMFERRVLQSNLDYPDLDYLDFSIIRTFSLVPIFSWILISTYKDQWELFFLPLKCNWNRMMELAVRTRCCSLKQTNLLQHFKRG